MHLSNHQVIAGQSGFVILGCQPIQVKDKFEVRIWESCVVILQHTMRHLFPTNSSKRSGQFCKSIRPFKTKFGRLKHLKHSDAVVFLVPGLPLPKYTSVNLHVKLAMCHLLLASREELVKSYFKDVYLWELLHTRQYIYGRLEKKKKFSARPTFEYLGEHLNSDLVAGSKIFQHPSNIRLAREKATATREFFSHCNCFGKSYFLTIIPPEDWAFLGLADKLNGWSVCRS